MLINKRSSFEKRVVRKCCPFFVLICSLLFASTLFAQQVKQELDEVRQLTEMGAVSLALQAINKQQPEFNYDEPAPWIEWERKRIWVYQTGHRWQALQQRVASYEDELPEDFYYWVKQQQVDALLTLKQGKQARQILQTLIWSDKKPELNLFALWQKKVIESYLLDAQVEDAMLAAQRYFQDHQSKDVDERLLRARILLRNQRADEVVELLKHDAKNPEAQVLTLFAQLRSNKISAKKVLKTALRKMRSKSATAKLKFMLWPVVVESAKTNQNLATVVIALESIVAGHKNIALPVGLFDFSADDLWDAYLEYALAIGNAEQYLVGDDQQWLKAAGKAAKKRTVVKARSLYALVMLRGQNNAARVQAAKGFLALMHKRKRGASLIEKLFLHSKYFPSLKSVPSPIRYDLVNIALSRSNIGRASNIMTTIQAAPAGINEFQWQLQRARIFVLGGKPEDAGVALTQLLENKSLSKKQLEYFLQILFDLQTVKQHELAITLFNKLLLRNFDARQQREIFFWIADSLKAQKDYERAARYYIRSAMYGESKGLDPWGQTARYQAAEMLSRASLLDDAHALYTDLLAVTKEPARRAVLKQALQKIQLLKNTKVTPKATAPTADTDLERLSDDAG